MQRPHRSAHIGISKCAFWLILFDACLYAPSKHGQDITIQALDEILPFASAWQVPSPTCADAPDDTRLEFKDFKKRAQSLASVAWRNTRATETGAKGWRHPSWPRISAAQQLQDIPTSTYRSELAFSQAARSQAMKLILQGEAH